MLISNVGFNPQVKRQNLNKTERNTIGKTENITFGLFWKNKIKIALKEAGITDKTILDAFGSLNGTIDTAPFCRYERFEGLADKPAEQLRIAVQIVEDIIINKDKVPQLVKFLRNESEIFKRFAKLKLPDN